MLKRAENIPPEKEQLTQSDVSVIYQLFNLFA